MFVSLYSLLNLFLVQLIWAFNAADGSKLTHFPVRVPGRVAAELTLAALSEIDVCEAPTILAGADDGACEPYNAHNTRVFERCCLWCV